MTVGLWRANVAESVGSDPDGLPLFELPENPDIYRVIDVKFPTEGDDGQPRGLPFLVVLERVVPVKPKPKKQVRVIQVRPAAQPEGEEAAVEPEGDEKEPASGPQAAGGQGAKQ